MRLHFVSDDPLAKSHEIEDEEFRTYRYSDGYAITINNPREVFIKTPPEHFIGAGGAHRVVDGSGVSHYIPAGWRHLFWQPVLDSCEHDMYDADRY